MKFEKVKAVKKPKVSKYCRTVGSFIFSSSIANVMPSPSLPEDAWISLNTARILLKWASQHPTFHGENGVC